MILYAIRAIATGKYFVHTDGNGTPIWNSTPSFCREPETIWKNLKRLCSQFYYEGYKLPALGERIWTRKNWKNFDPALLRHYEVVTFNVSVIGSEVISAPNFVVPETLAEMDVKIK